eukprot:comp17294_c0_seq1/m.28975 comp17294_c0_seq1/g.28975  ORF comp17294_c0_seq1/g.28975 comp17294_c0_seq1/m.28975 type:complete len:195 (-) comp17294_c0_seq1:635-1219(-)
MISGAFVIHRGGLVLWSSSSDFSVVTDVVRTALLESRGSDSQLISGTACAKWALSNDLDLVFVIVFPRVLALSWIDLLLGWFKDEFVDMFGSQLRAIRKKKGGMYDPSADYDKWNVRWAKLLAKAEGNTTKPAAALDARGTGSSKVHHHDDAKQSSSTASGDDDGNAAGGKKTSTDNKNEDNNNNKNNKNKTKK